MLFCTKVYQFLEVIGKSLPILLFAGGIRTIDRQFSFTIGNPVDTRGWKRLLQRVMGEQHDDIIMLCKLGEMDPATIIEKTKIADQYHQATRESHMP